MPTARRWGWTEAFASADAARQAILAECRSRGGGSGCIVRAWGCNGPVVEEGLNLDRAARRQIQQGLAAEGFDPGGADGLFGPRPRAAIRRWQSSGGGRATGYLNGASAEALRTAGGAGAAVAAVAVSTPPAVTATQAPPPPASVAQENLFWQSIMNSTNAAEFEAYLSQFPNGVFRALAQARLAALRSQSDATCSCICNCAGSDATAPATGEAATASAAAGTASRAESEDDSERFEIEPVTLRPSVNFFRSKKPDSGEIDPWKSTIAFQMASVDFRWRIADTQLRVGFSPSFGVLPLKNVDGMVLMLGVFLQYRDLFRVEAGYGYAYAFKDEASAGENGSPGGDNQAGFLSIGLPGSIFGRR